MKPVRYFIPFLFSLLFILSSCQLATDIFKGGVYVGILIVIVVIALIIWIIRKII